MSEGPGSSNFAFTSPSDPSSDDTTAGFHYAYSCTGASLAGATYAGSGTATSVNCVFGDGPSSPTVRARVIDKDGGFTEYAAAVTVNNVAPTATFGAVTPIFEGSMSAISLSSAFDPSGPDTSAGFHYAFSCTNGDLSGATYANTAGNGSSTMCFFDDGPSAHTVKARIIDKDGGFSEYTASVDVNNVAPVATFSDNGPINEGSSATITFSSPSDPSTADTNAGFHYTFACDGLDGSLAATYAAAGAPVSTTCAFDDGPASPVVKGRIFDKDNGFSGYSTTVTVNNVAPTATFGNNGPVNEGSNINLSLTSQFDPSLADTTAGFEYRFSCNDGTTWSPWSGTNTGTCPTTDNGTVKVKGQIRDKDLGTSTYSADVTVNNVAPTATFGNTGPVNEGSSFDLSLISPFDPSLADTTAGFEYAFDCGSGYGAFSATSSATCPTTDNGVRSVKGKIRDKDGGVTEYTASVTVNNVAPTIAISGA
ncbi:MAG: hypothetical protein E6I65_03160, partial [Chloroflexi bacterium]